MVRGKNMFVQSNETHYREEKRAELQMLVVDGESETSDVKSAGPSAQNDDRR